MGRNPDGGGGLRHVNLPGGGDNGERLRPTNAGDAGMPQSGERENKSH